MAKRNTYFQDEVIERKIDIKQLGRTLRYVLPYKKVFFLVGILMFVSSLVALIPALILKNITDVVIPNKDMPLWPIWYSAWRCLPWWKSALPLFIPD